MRMHANDANKKRELIYPEFSFKLTGIFYEIHNKLGRHLLEKQYADALETALKDLKIPYTREARVSVRYRQQDIPAGNVDFIIDNKVAVDIKAKKFPSKDDYHKILRYLKAKGLRLGLIVNFRDSYLKPKRVLNSELRGIN